LGDLESAFHSSIANQQTIIPISLEIGNRQSSCLEIGNRKLAIVNLLVQKLAIVNLLVWKSAIGNWPIVNLLDGCIICVQSAIHG
jgi:hypothetical protein